MLNDNLECKFCKVVQTKFLTHNVFFVAKKIKYLQVIDQMLHAPLFTLNFVQNFKVQNSAKAERRLN